MYIYVHFGMLLVCIRIPYGAFSWGANFCDFRGCPAATKITTHENLTRARAHTERYSVTITQRRALRGQRRGYTD